MRSPDALFTDVKSLRSPSRFKNREYYMLGNYVDFSALLFDNFTSFRLRDGHDTLRKERETERSLFFFLSNR